MASNSDPIGKITDKSASAAHFTQGTSGNKPLYKTNIQNSRSMGLWDSSDDYLTNTISISQPSTWFIVVKPSTPGGGCFLFDGVDGSNRNVIYLSSNTARIYAGSDVNPSVSVDTTTQLLVGLFNGASSNVYRNGVAGNVVNAGTQGVAGVTLGARDDFASPADGYIGELIVYASALNDTDRGAVESYINGKWAIY